MAIRRPGIANPEWICQDFLYIDNAPEQHRYVQVKWDGELYTRTSQTFDYSNPPFADFEQRGGHIVGQINYTIVGKLVTIDDWSVNWRDEMPLRVASNFITQCLYSLRKGYTFRVDKRAYAFWVSERFTPLTNSPLDYLVT